MGTVIEVLKGDGALVLKDGASRLERRHLANLHITSGQIAACDPRVSARDVVPFARPIGPGRYAVHVGLLVRGASGEKRVALAWVEITGAPPVRWIDALPVGMTPGDPECGEPHRYDVDAGVGCFADVTALRAFDECGDDATDEALASMKTNDEPAWTWADIRTGDDGENVILFTSGYGDGSYASFWGLDEAGTPVCLVTDFGLCEVAWGSDATVG